MKSAAQAGPAITRTSFAALADRTAGLMGAIGIRRADVLGWSMGGFVAQRLARRAPARVAALALIATDPGGPEAVAAEPAVWQRLTDHSGSAREQASRLIPLLFPPALAPAIDEQFGELIAAGRAAMAPEALAAQERAMSGWHRQGAGAAPAPGPVAVVHGAEDVVIPAANAERLAACWSGARVEVLPGAAHAVMAQEPQRVAAAIFALGA